MRSAKLDQMRKSTRPPGQGNHSREFLRVLAPAALRQRSILIEPRLCLNSTEATSWYLFVDCGRSSSEPGTSALGAHRTAGVDVERSALRPVHFMSQQVIDERPASPVAAPPRGSRCRGRDRSPAPAIGQIALFLHWQGVFERLCNAGWCSMCPTWLRGTMELLAIMPFACRRLDNATSHLHVEDLKFGWTTFALRDLNCSCRGAPLKSKLADDFASRSYQLC
jgi:hypothetical protein